MASEASLARLVLIFKNVRRLRGWDRYVAEPGDGSARDFRGGGEDARGAV